MSKQSSVEWLQWALEHTILTHEQTMQTIGLFEQAKAIHKEEIIDAHGVQYDYSYSQIDPKKVTGEQYYNETFGGNK